METQALKTQYLNWISSIYEEQRAESRGLRTISTMSRGIVENTNGLARLGVFFFFSWQMGPCRTLQSVVPPYRGATSSRQAENSCSSCLGPCHLRLPLMVSNNPSNSIGFYYYSTFTINMVFWRFTYAETQNLTPRKEE